MDITNVNPSAHADQEQFPLGGGKFKHIPAVAKGQSVTAAARKLHRGVEIYEGVTISVPQPEATAIASSVVDPTALRNDLERKRVSMHRTPSGYTLVSVEARVWSAAVSCDGANGRGRLEVKLAGGSVWPLPDESTSDTSMRYVTRDIDRMRAAVRDNAKRIGSPDMRQSLREHPHGVWNPIYLVPGLIELAEDGEAGSESGFVHVAEGSTRVVTCQEGLGIAADEPVAYAGATMDLVRRVRAGVATRISMTPDSDDASHAVKVLTLPAHIIIGVLDDEHQVSTKPFPEIISEFVQSIHEQPRPWNVLAQGGVRGERLVRDLVAAGRLTADQGRDIVGRDEHHEITTPPNVIAGRLLRAATHPNARDQVRRAILEDATRQQLTRKRFAQTVGPLLLTLYPRDLRQKTAGAALTNEFQPQGLNVAGWTVREDASIPEVLDEALAGLEVAPGTLSPASQELMARSVGALACLGLVLSDQGSAVNEKNWLRGSVAKVVQALALCAGGLKILAEAAEYIEGRNGGLPPQLYDADGAPVVDDAGNHLRLNAQAGANLRIRELAFRDDQPIDEDDDDQELSPYDRYVRAQRHAVETFAGLEEEITRLYELTDDTGKVLIDERGLRRDLMADLPDRLLKLRDEVLLALEDEPEPFEEDGTGEHDALEAIERAMDDDYADAA